MGTETFSLTYASSITDFCEINSSFDSALLQIAYHGDNRHKTNISKAVFEKCVKTLFNCPVVCNYDREEDTLGDHDVEIVTDDDGNSRLVHITHPIGVVPVGARTFWKEVEEKDGSIKEYLCADVLLWKRQEAYRKIKKDGIAAHSMEIVIKDGKRIDGIYHILDFEFTALTLIGVAPCFESAALVFHKEDFELQFSTMMQELKEGFTEVMAHFGDDNTKQEKISTEGGQEVLMNKDELVAKYSIDIDSLDFSIEDYDVEELEAKFQTIAEEKQFALNRNVINEIHNALSKMKVVREYGECNKYSYEDCDIEQQMVYCWDTDNWLLYGFSYELDGDNVVIDFDSKKRMKYVIAEFDEGEQGSPFMHVFEMMQNKLEEYSDVAEKFSAASEAMASMETELSELRQYKLDIEKANRDAERAELFGKFSALAGIEDFEALKEDCDGLDLATIEEKCYAIKGKHAVSHADFSLNNEQLPVVKVDVTGRKDVNAALPYGGLHEKYGFHK